jgi:CRP-like cAMP-binding protein
MSDRPLNVFLRSLGADSFNELASHLTPIDLVIGETLYRPGDKVESVYFPETALLSLLTATAEGQSIETAMIGVEGASGVLEACGSGRTNLDCIVQVDGRGLRAPASVIRSLATRDEGFGRQAWTLIEFQMAESRQSGMCNALHPVEKRLARWLLECAERCGGRPVLPLTQEFLAAMLGVQRTTVNTFAAQLQKAGLISYSRGKVTILDANGLEQQACECRVATKVQRERLGFGVQAGQLRLVREREADGRS